MTPKDENKGIWSRIFDGISAGLWFLIKAAVLIGTIVWVQAHPIEATNIVTTIVDGVVDGAAFVFHWIAENVKPENTPNVH